MSSEITVVKIRNLVPRVSSETNQWAKTQKLKKFLLLDNISSSMKHPPVF